MGNKKYQVGVLGATGAVGQRFVQYLANHSWFHIHSLMASEKSARKAYLEAAHWCLDQAPPEYIKKKVIKPCIPESGLDFVFSGLEASVAGEIEALFAESGIPVISNTRTYRMKPEVPLIIPEINPDHLALIDYQSFDPRQRGFIVTNPNCSAAILSLALAPLIERWDISHIIVTTMQALSGAGYPGVSSLDIIDNIIPHIPGEEDKLETEPAKIFGKLKTNYIENAKIQISARCHRVHVMDGHLLSVSVKFKDVPDEDKLIQAWTGFRTPEQVSRLPSAPEKPVIYLGKERPQPRMHRMMGNGMSVVIGGVRRCSVLDYHFTVLGHNTIRGAVGGSVLVAELLAVSGYFGGSVIHGGHEDEVERE